MSATRKLSFEPLESRRLLSRSTFSTLTGSAPSAIVGAAVTFTDRVTSPAGVPTGSVEFIVDGHATSLVQLRAGTASFSDKALVVGKHTIVAEFVPQRGTVWASSSATFAESVTAPPAPAAPSSQNSSSQIFEGGTLLLGSTSSTVLNTQQGATLQLAGGASLTSQGGTLAVSNAGSTNVNPEEGTIALSGSGSALGPGTINVASQAPLAFTLTTAGELAGGQGLTLYTGSTTVGDGTNAAVLTANQILQKSLTISNQTIAVSPGTEILGDGGTLVE